MSIFSFPNKITVAHSVTVSLSEKLSGQVDRFLEILAQENVDTGPLEAATARAKAKRVALQAELDKTPKEGM